MAEAQTQDRAFLFLSDLIGKKVTDFSGVILGRITDVTAEFVDPYPIVTAFIIGVRHSHQLLLPYRDLVGIERGEYKTNRTASDLAEYNPKEGEWPLNSTLMDKQIVDTNGARIRRVNDLQLLLAQGKLYLVHVDVGFRGLMRRVGLAKAMDRITKALFDYTLSDQFISWKFVQPISSPDLLRLTISQSRLNQIHPADLADLLEELDVHRRTAVFQALDTETAAETLEETDPRIQVSLISDLNSAEASDILEEMSLSEATDLLADLPRSKAEGILQEMEKEVAEDVKELMAHPESEAGGMMTTSFLSFRPNVTAKEAIDHIRREGEDIDVLYYVYVTDDEQHLLGVASLRDLILAPGDAKLSDIMDKRVISVRLDAKEKKIAEQFAKYAVASIPVVDDNDRLQGIIMLKNLLETVAPNLGK